MTPTAASAGANIEDMFSIRFIGSAAVALGVYGALTILIAVTMVVVGYWTFDQLSALQTTLEAQRSAVVQSIRTVSGTVRDTAGATGDLQRSIESARGAADQASGLANDSAGTFRDLGANLTNLTILGLQPLAGIGPQFDRSADQLQQLAISLGATREALAQNRSDVQRIGADLGQLQVQLDSLALSLNQPLVLGTRGLLPCQIAFYGLCLVLVMQSLLSIAASVMLLRLQRALTAESKVGSLESAYESRSQHSHPDQRQGPPADCNSCRRDAADTAGHPGRGPG